VDCRIIATAESLDAVWADLLPQETGQRYTKPGLTIFRQATSTGCGTASSEVGPFYCPVDQTAYFDSSFFQVLSDRFGSSSGPLAQEYVVAHEFGHHIQNELGLLGRSQQDPQGPESGSVRTELMADCLAGVWAAHAASTPDPQTGEPFLKPLTKQDISDALSAAAAVGDDRIQKSAQGRVNPEAWTHGSSEQRQKWFVTGYQSGSLGSCDTFSAADLG
jgi:predicted metalloprotease